MEPASRQGFLGGFQPVQVPQHHVGTPDHHFAGFALGHFPALGIQDADFFFHQGQANGAKLHVPRPVYGHHRRRFGQAVAFQHRMAKLIRKLLPQYLAQGSSAANKFPYRGKLGGLGPFQQQLHHRRHPGKQGNPMALYQPDGSLEIVVGLDHQLGPQKQAQADADAPGVAVVHGQQAEDNIFRPGMDGVLEIPGVGYQILMAEHSPFGPARSSGGINDGAVVVLRPGDLLQTAAYRSVQFPKGQLPHRGAAQLCQRPVQFQFGLGQEQMNLRILDHVGHFPGHQLEINGNNHAPSPDYRHIGRYVFRTVPGKQAHPFPLFQSGFL